MRAWEAANRQCEAQVRSARAAKALQEKATAGRCDRRGKRLCSHIAFGDTWPQAIDSPDVGRPAALWRLRRVAKKREAYLLDNLSGSDRAQFLRLLKLVHADVSNRSESNLRRNQDLALAATGFQAFEHVGQFLDLDCVAHKQPGFDRPLIEQPK